MATWQQRGFDLAGTPQIYRALSLYGSLLRGGRSIRKNLWSPVGGGREQRHPFGEDLSTGLQFSPNLCAASACCSRTAGVAEVSPPGRSHIVCCSIRVNTFELLGQSMQPLIQIMLLFSTVPPRRWPRGSSRRFDPPWQGGSTRLPTKHSLLPSLLVWSTSLGVGHQVRRRKTWASAIEATRWQSSALSCPR